MKRQRGRGRHNKPPGHHHNHHNQHNNNNPNRSFESTGPDVKVRGPAAQIYEKYQQLARDAHGAGDRVMAESYLQHAEHYFRLLRAMQPMQPPPQFEPRYDQAYDGEGEEGEDQGEEIEAEGQPSAEGEVRADRPDRERQDRGDRFERGPRPPREDRGPRQPREARGEDRGPRPERAERPERVEAVERAEGDAAEQPPVDGEGPFTGDREDFRARGRRRRGRFRPGGEGPEEARADERPRREGAAEERGPVEGFGSAAPAFLTGE